MRILNSLYLFFLLFGYISAQSPDWILFDPTNSGIPSTQINCITNGKNSTIWFGTSEGLALYNGSKWEVFNSANSDLPSPVIYSICQDGKLTWIGTDSGLVMFDGNDWQSFPQIDIVMESKVVIEIIKDFNNNLWVMTELELLKLSSSDFSVQEKHSFIGTLNSLAVDSVETVWIGDFNHASFNGVLWSYNGANFKIFRLNNYVDLISSFPYVLTADKNYLWMGTGGTTGGRLVRIDPYSPDLEWLVFTEDNSGLPGGGIKSIEVQDTVIWIGTSMGLVSFNNSKWTLYDKSNSGIPANEIISLENDNNGNIWIGTIDHGAAVFNPTGVLLSEDGTTENNISFTLHQNYPNPFNPATKINWQIPVESHVILKIYDILGKEIVTLVDEVIKAGKYSSEFSASDLTSGIYMYRITAGNFTEVKKMIFLK